MATGIAWSIALAPVESTGSWLAEAQIKVFTIVNGDALGLVEVLEDLFGQYHRIGQSERSAANRSARQRAIGPQIDQTARSTRAARNASDCLSVDARCSYDCRTDHPTVL